LSAFTHILTYVGTPGLVLALGSFARRVSREVLLHRAETSALKHGTEDPHGKAALKIVKALTDEPWYRAILPWCRPDEGSGP